MIFWMAIVGVLLLLVCGFAGVIYGGVFDDPDLKAAIEEAKKERERKAAWEAKKKS
jgi:hypothetical protein